MLYILRLSKKQWATHVVRTPKGKIPLCNTYYKDKKTTVTQGNAEEVTCKYCLYILEKMTNKR